jgi:taurine dioxygenase
MDLGYRHFEVMPIAGSGGAEIRGLDLSQPLSVEVYDELQTALARFLLLCFRDQDLTDDQFEAWASGLGKLQPHVLVKPIPGHPNMLAIERRADEQPDAKVVGEDWHSDAPWLDRPVAGSILYNLEAPPWGGDTQFCNLYLAYASLSDGLKEAIDPLMLRSAAAAGASYLTSVKDAAGGAYDMTELKEVRAHPLVRIHPATGRKCLAVTGPYGYCIEGWTPEESKPLIDFLTRQATRAEHVFRVRWARGTVAVWDNRCMLHQAIKDYQGFGRRMRRLQFAGERPFGPPRPAET